jgi:alpha,alpha-trehalase
VFLPGRPLVPLASELPRNDVADTLQSMSEVSAKQPGPTSTKRGLSFGWIWAAILLTVALVAASCSSADPSSSGTTVTGLVGADGKEVVIAKGTDLPPQLQACLDEKTSISKADFESQCVMPYINGLWVDPKGLLRPHDSLATAAKDWLLKEPADGRWPIYYPNDLKPARSDLNKMLKKDENLATQVELKELPSTLPIPSADPDSIYNQAGLVYVPNSYIVPGGIFNEQYGWDSYFMIAGLLGSAEYVLANPTSQYWSPTESRMISLTESTAPAFAKKLFTIAKGMADNQAFMTDFYAGHVPNANRIYYLTRSQPPLFAAESLLIYDFAKKNAELVPYEGQETLAPYLDIKAPTTYEGWIKKEILPAAETYYRYWTDPKTTVFAEKTNPRVTQKDGHSVYLYHPDGVGPAPEIVHSQIPGNENLYRNDAAYFKANPNENPDNRFYDPKGGDPTFHLTQDFYLADRSVRASGYDLSGRYGDVGQHAADYSPVALNMLLLAMAKDMNKMSQIADEKNSVSAKELADYVSAADSLMWIPGSDGSGPYYSDTWIRKGEESPPSPYLFGTTFYPLWAGAVQDQDRVKMLTDTVTAPGQVTQEQIYFLTDKDGEITPKKVEQTGELSTCKLSDPKNPASCSDVFTKTSQGPLALVNESNFGIPTSLRLTGNQWDFSNGWAPVQYFASGGFENVGNSGLAQQIDDGWVQAVDIGFASTGTIIEKYSATNPVADVQVTSGYSKAQIGFGWTNGVYVTALRSVD